MGAMEPETATPPLVLPLAPPPGPAGDVLRYAETGLDKAADRRSADREMTWRLARANGFAAVGVGVLACIMYLSAAVSAPGQRLSFVLVPALALVAPGAALL